MECAVLLGKDRMSIAGAAQLLPSLAVGLLLFPQMVDLVGVWLAVEHFTGICPFETGAKRPAKRRDNGQPKRALGKQPFIKWY